MSRVSDLSARRRETVMREFSRATWARASSRPLAQRPRRGAQRAAVGDDRVAARIARVRDDVVTGLTEIRERLRRFAAARTRGQHRDREHLELVALRAALRRDEPARVAQRACEATGGVA